MFGIDSAELLIIAIVALLVIGPKDLPKVMRTVGMWVSRARGTARHFRSGIDTMIREAELEEMQKKWAAQNERIMSEHAGLPPGEADSAVAPPTEVVEDAAPAERPRPPPAPPRKAARPSAARPAPAAPPRELP